MFCFSAVVAVCVCCVSRVEAVYVNTYCVYVRTVCTCIRVYVHTCVFSHPEGGLSACVRDEAQRDLLPPHAREFIFSPIGARLYRR